MLGKVVGREIEVADFDPLPSNSIIELGRHLGTKFLTSRSKSLNEIQDQSANILISFMDKSTWLPDDGKKAIAHWIAAADDEYEKKGTNYFTKHENADNAKMKK
jgi:hypothetical protein